MGTKLIDLDSYPVEIALNTLLKDKTTRKNIIFATDIYSSYAIGEKASVTKNALNVISIQPRVEKSIEEKAQRTKTKAEVFTPSWIVNQMNNFCDEDWFGRKAVFNTENDEKKNGATIADIADLNSQFDEERQKMKGEMLENINKQVHSKELIDKAAQTVVKTVETEKKNALKVEIES